VLDLEILDRFVGIELDQERVDRVAEELSPNFGDGAAGQAAAVMG
jgi:hypothetical protein